MSPEALERALNHGAREVFAYNFEERKYYICDSAAQFIMMFGLSKKAVTTALAVNKLRKIDSWVMTYNSEENVKKLKDFVNSPVFA